LINFNLKLIKYQIVKIRKKNLVCDFHTLPKKTKCKNIIFVTIILGGLNVLMPITCFQIPNNQLAQVLRECYFNKNSSLLQNKKLRKNQ
jgi:hypothetical protein